MKAGQCPREGREVYKGSVMPNRKWCPREEGRAQMKVGQCQMNAGRVQGREVLNAREDSVQKKKRQNPVWISVHYPHKQNHSQETWEIFKRGFLQ